ncbi:hypothetical protein FRB99_007145 [Tulasnella sp. 403]|nr:hypothetical protein FRB99_007145 [Tulasnella sp. 403]
MHVALRQDDVLYLICSQMDSCTVYRAALTTRTWTSAALQTLWSSFKIPFDKLIGILDLGSSLGPADGPPGYGILLEAIHSIDSGALARFLDRAAKITILHYNLIIPPDHALLLKEIVAIKLDGQPLFPRLVRLITRSHDTHLPIRGVLASSRLKDLQIKDVLLDDTEPVVATLQDLYLPVASQIQDIKIGVASHFDYSDFKNLRSLRHWGVMRHETLSSLASCTQLQSLRVSVDFASIISSGFKVELPSLRKLSLYQGHLGVTIFLQSLHLPNLCCIRGQFKEDCLPQILEFPELNCLRATFLCQFDFQNVCKIEKLQSLTISQPHDKSEVDDSCISTLAHALPGLKLLAIIVRFGAGAKKTDHVTKLTLDSLLILSKLCTSLESLTLGVDARGCAPSSPRPTERFASLKTLQLSPIYVTGQDPTVLVGWLDAICPEGLPYKLDVVTITLANGLTAAGKSGLQRLRSKWALFVKRLHPRRLANWASSVLKTGTPVYAYIE